MAYQFGTMTVRSREPQTLLAAWLSVAGKSGNWLAGKLGISRQGIYRWTDGGGISKASVLAICEVTGLPPGPIFTGEKRNEWTIEISEELAAKLDEDDDEDDLAA